MYSKKNLDGNQLEIDNEVIAKIISIWQPNIFFF